MRPIVIGQRLGRYRVDALLGAGGMGVVYLASDRRGRRRVAIKVLDPNRSDRFGGESLLQEARVAATLSHPAICAVHEVGHVGTEPFIVMEHVPGVPLGTIIPSDAGLELRHAIGYTLQIVDAVAHAHRHGIVHGDLKSTNVMVVSGGAVKVLDFGLSVQRRDANGSSGVDTTRPHPTSSACGTVPYMSPELLRGQRADTRSDVWALGVLIFEMMAGRRPFAGATRYEVAASILGGRQLPPPAHVPAPLASILAGCLAVDREERYPSAIELSAAVSDIVPALSLPNA